MATSYRLMPDVSDMVPCVSAFARYAVLAGLGGVTYLYYKGTKVACENEQLKLSPYKEEKVAQKQEKDEKKLSKTTEGKSQTSLDNVVQAKEEKTKTTTKASARNSRKRELRKAKKAAEKAGGNSTPVLDIQVAVRQEPNMVNHAAPTSSAPTDQFPTTCSSEMDNSEGFETVKSPRKKRSPNVEKRAEMVATASSMETKHEKKVATKPYKPNTVAIPLNFPQKKEKTLLPVKIPVHNLSEPLVQWDLDSPIAESTKALNPRAPTSKSLSRKYKPVVNTTMGSPACIAKSAKSPILKDIGPPAISAWKPLPKPPPVSAPSKNVEEVVTEEPASEPIPEQLEASSRFENIENIEATVSGESTSDPVEEPAETVSMSPKIEKIEETASSQPEAISSDEQTQTTSEPSPMSIPGECNYQDFFEEAAPTGDSSSSAVTTPDKEEFDAAAPSKTEQNEFVEAIATALPASSIDEKQGAANPSEDEEKELATPEQDERREEKQEWSDSSWADETNAEIAEREVAACKAAKAAQAA